MDKERCLFCSHAHWTVGCSESWHVPHLQLGGTTCLAEWLHAALKGRQSSTFLAWFIYVFIYLKPTSPIAFTLVCAPGTEQCRHTDAVNASPFFTADQPHLYRAITFTQPWFLLSSMWPLQDASSVCCFFGFGVFFQLLCVWRSYRFKEIFWGERGGRMLFGE